jgi:ferritin-like protein
MSHAGYHEPFESLSTDVVDRHRAIISLMEEFEAIDWYDQRLSATGDESLQAILAHNRDDEKEHAAMLLEWLRRHDAQLDEQLQKYLFKSGDITALENTGEDAPSTGGLALGDLRKEPPR